MTSVSKQKQYDVSIPEIEGYADLIFECPYKAYNTIIDIKNVVMKKIAIALSKPKGRNTQQEDGILRLFGRLNIINKKEETFIIQILPELTFEEIIRNHAFYVVALKIHHFNILRSCLQIPELAGFPPGLLPVCVAYVPLEN